MPGLNHVRRVASHNVVSGAISDETFKRLEAHCAKHNASRSLVIRDFIEFCLDVCEGGEATDALSNEIAAAMSAERRKA